MSENYDKENILTTIKNILILIYIHLMQIYVKCPNETEDLSEECIQSLFYNFDDLTL